LVDPLPAHAEQVADLVSADKVQGLVVHTDDYRRTTTGAAKVAGDPIVLRLLIGAGLVMVAADDRDHTATPQG
jgi:hypothetical protein